MIKNVSISLALAALLLSGCSEKKEEGSKPQATSEKATETAAESAPAMQGLYGVDTASVADDTAAQSAHAQQMPAQQAAAHTATVVETVDAAGYTYVNVDENGQTYWIAGPKTTVKVGDTISYVEQMWMENFPSKSLNKTFDRLMFVATIVPAGAGAATQASAAKGGSDCSNCDTHKKQAAEQAAAAPATVTIEKAEGEQTVEGIFQNKAELSGKLITLKGNVTKVSRGIMGKDWVHIQDGTGAAGTNDLVVTSPSADVEVGDVVTLEGVVKTDVDLGAGYFYAVMVEEAKFTK